MILLFLIKILLYSVTFFILLVVCAFIRLFFSRNKYVQKEIDVNKLRKGDIILTGTNNNLSSFYIKISNILTNGIQDKFWTHAALHIEKGKLIEAQPEGIVYNSIQDYLSKKTLVKVYRNKYIDDSNVALNKMIDFCENAKKEGCKYGTVGLIFYVFSIALPVTMNFIFNNKTIDKLCNLDKAYFCSELVADAYGNPGYRISPYDGWRIKPSDFIKNPFFEEII